MSAFEQCPWTGNRLNRLPRAVASALLVTLAFGAVQVQAQDSSTIYLKPSVGTLSYQDVVEPLVSTGSNGCQLQTSNLKLLTIEGTGRFNPLPGWTTRDGQIGVNATSSGSPCTQVRVGQGVKLSLGSQFANSRVASATLRLKANPRATVQITTYNNGTMVHQFPADCRQTCAITVDGTNALDSTGAVPTRWNSVVIESVRGNTNSESGSFGLVDSDFDIVLGFVPDGNLSCGDDADDGAASLRRLFNAVGDTGEGCREIPYALSFDGNTLEFLADYNVLPPGVEPAFEFDVTNDPEIVSVPDYLARAAGSTLATFAGSVPLSIQWFDDDTNRFVLDFCPGVVAYDQVSNLLAGVTFPAGFEIAANDMSPSLDGFQYGCLVDRKITVLEPIACGFDNNAEFPENPMPADQICVEVREVGYLRGDYTRTRVF